MDVSVFGLGYVGLVTFACLARDGHRVIGVDIDTGKLDAIRAGRAPVLEPGLAGLLADVVGRGLVHVTSDVGEAVHATDVSLICVGTPAAQEGGQDQTALLRVTRALAIAMRDKPAVHVLAYRSTMAPGTVDTVLRPLLEDESGKREGSGFHVACQPEFLREGSSLRDFDEPPYTIVGIRDPAGATPLRELFGHLPCDFHVTTVRIAEAAKYCCNNFHSLKIAFANETARLCQAIDVDPFAVMDLLCRDRRLNLSPAYLKPGNAFGGSCLPKDLQLTLDLAARHEVAMPLHEAIATTNRAHLDRALDLVLAAGGERVALIGLAFKAGTDDLRESPLVLLAERLLAAGRTVTVFAPQIRPQHLTGANRQFVDARLPSLSQLLRERLSDAVAGADTLVLGVDEPALADLIEARHAVVDLVGVRDRDRLRGRYAGLCW